MSDSDGAFAYLPPTLADIAREAGLPAALKLMREKGGTKVFIPKRAPDDHWLVLLVGREAADRLGAYYASGQVFIPVGDRSSHRAYLRQRRQAVADLVENGSSLNTVALETGMHARSVSRHKARLREDDGGLCPGPLFGSLKTKEG